MFTHACVGSDDLLKSKTFYDAALGALGVAAGTIHGDKLCMYGTETGAFLVMAPANGQPMSHGNGSTIGFAAGSKDAVDAFHAAGAAHGGTDEGQPGPRENAGGAYGAYLRDPFGNKICAYNGL
ncbi:MAG TPA: VOC family protein [Sphingobium sp.]